MKKIFFFAAIAALALSSCSSEELVQAEQPVEDGAVTFSAYAGRANRATAEVITDAAGLAAKGGFGVFAYDQYTTKWASYSATNSYPNFMYNQNVTSEDGSTWIYTPVKYFNNNADALHSFFAYGPYSKDVKVVFSNNGPAVRYNANDQYDLLYAPATIDLKKPSVTSKINFAFDHALSKVDFKVAYFLDKVHSDAAHTANEGTIGSETTITLRSVKFIGNVPSQGLLNLSDGQWTYEAANAGAYEFCPVPVQVDQSVTNYVAVSKDNFVIPTASDVNVKVQVIYDVVTKDTENPQNSSKITNVIESENSFNLAKATAYTFNLDLGLTSVKFTATVDDWDTEKTEYVDLPNNINYTAVPFAVVAASNVVSEAPDDAGTLGDVRFCTADSKLYYYTGTDWINLTNDCLKAEMEDGTFKYYKYVTDSYVEMDSIEDVSELKGKPDGFYVLKETGTIYKVQN